MRDFYDCLVIGAGPAGSTAATLVAMSGYRTLLVERDKMPRFHIGESLMPETYWQLDRLGVLERMRRSEFVRKSGVQFVSHTGRESQRFSFAEHDPRECSCTWQVERDKFDQMLYENAAEKGAECRDGTSVQEVLFDGDRATGARLKLNDGTERDVAARVVVDASGLQSIVAKRLGLRVANPRLRKAAIWGYYRNARRDPGDHGGATLILHTDERKSWFWFIPLANNITSIGVVGDHAYLLNGRGKRADVFEDELVKCPALVERLIHAELVSDFGLAQDFSHSTTRHAGDGWVLVGDAFGFIDPLYSSGVFLALRSGELAADAIVEGFQSGDLSAAQLGRWTDEFQKGMQWIRKLVEAFYAHPFCFDEFLRRHPQHKGNLVDVLIGRVFHEGAGKIFDDLDPMIQRLLGEAGLSPPHATKTPVTVN